MKCRLRFAATVYGLIGLLVIVLLIVMISISSGEPNLLDAISVKKRASKPVSADV
jgi:hypothetical protein